MKLKSWSNLIIFILLPLIVGQLSAFLTRGNINTYETIITPSFAPPSYVFPVVWTVLYILMGVSSYIVYTEVGISTKAFNVYLLQLFFNFMWSLIFFGLQNYTLAFLWILILILLIIIMIVEFYKIKPVAGYLQIPYLAWCVFAAFLNLTVIFLN